MVVTETRRVSDGGVVRLPKIIASKVGEGVVYWVEVRGDIYACARRPTVGSILFVSRMYKDGSRTRIPVHARRRLNITDGDTLIFVCEGEDVYCCRVEIIRRSDVASKPIIV